MSIIGGLVRVEQLDLTLFNVIREGAFGLRVECIVEVFFDGVQVDSSDADNTRGQVHVFSTSFLCATQQTLVKHFVLQHEHGPASIATVAITLDWIQHMFVEMRVGLKSSVATVEASSMLDAVVNALAAASL